MIRNYKNVIAILLLAFCSFSCLEDLKFVPETAKDGTITASIDGEPFDVESGQGVFGSEFIVAELEEEKDHFVLTVFGVEIEEDGKAFAMGIKIGGENINEMKAGNVYKEWVPIDGFEEVYSGAMGGVEKRKSVNAKDNIFKAGSNHTGEMEISITEIDFELKKISGTFSFTALDEDKDVRIEVKSGVFQGIEWTNI